MKMLQALYTAVLEEPTDEQPLHPLHAAISLNAFERIVNKDRCLNHEFIGVLMLDSKTCLQNIFITVHALHVAEANSEDEEKLHMFVTTHFLKHYHFCYGESLLFKPVTCMPISKVVFAARSEDSFRWSRTEDWSKKLSSVVSEKNILCRHNDVFLCSPKAFALDNYSMLMDLYAIMCEPLDQGLIVSNTSVIVLNITNDVIQRSISFDLKSRLYPENNYFDSQSTSLQRKTIPDAKAAKPGDSADVLKFKILIISQFDIYFQKSVLENDGVIDPLSTVFINKRTLMNRNLESGMFVMAKLTVSDDHRHRRTANNFSIPCGDKKFVERFVTVCSLDDRINSLSEDNVAYVSPQLWFNLNPHPARLLQPHYELILQHSLNDSSPSYAKEIYVALVQSPNYSGTISCDSILKNYFQTPRLLCKGDILCIDTRDAVEFQTKNEEFADSIAYPIIYFRVSMLLESTSSESGYLVDRECTKLYQSGTAQSYVPMTIERFHSAQTNSLYFSSPTPPGLNYYVDSMEEIIEPLLNVQNHSRFQVSSNILLTGSPGCGKTVVVRAICKRLNLHLYQINCHQLLGENSATIEARLKIIMQKASVFAPCVLLLRNIEFIGTEKELKGENSRVLSSSTELLKGVNQSENELPVIVIATSTPNKLTSDDLSAAFLHVVNMEPPDENDRSAMISSLLHPALISHDISFRYLAQRTAGFVLADLVSLVSEAGKNQYLRLQNLIAAKKSVNYEEDVVLAGFPIVQKDFFGAIEKLQTDLAKSSGAPKIPNVFWEDIGGLENVKQEILDTIQLPLEYPEIVSSGLRRSGILLYGPPGTGKTLLAKAVATECSLNFMSVKGPELINMYVGQSEENVRAVFDQARAAVPCIIFFDELDSLAPNRGRSGDSGGVMDRVVSQLLSEINGLDSCAQVFVIGATNRPDLIDPALLRPGRFDRLVYVGIPSDKNSQLSILQALTRKMQLAGNVDLKEIVEKCPDTISGADLYSLCSDAMMVRIEKNVESIESGKLKLEDAKVALEKEDFIAAIEKLVPSVSESELVRYEKIKKKL